MKQNNSFCRGERYTRLAYFVSLGDGVVERASVYTSLAGPVEDDILPLLACHTSASGAPYQLQEHVRPPADVVSFLTGTFVI